MTDEKKIRVEPETRTNTQDVSFTFFLSTAPGRGGAEYSMHTAFKTVDDALDAAFHIVDRFNDKYDDQAFAAIEVLKALGAYGVISVRGKTTQLVTDDAARDIAAQIHAADTARKES